MSRIYGSINWSRFSLRWQEHDLMSDMIRNFHRTILISVPPKFVLPENSFRIRAKLIRMPSSLLSPLKKVLVTDPFDLLNVPPLFWSSTNLSFPGIYTRGFLGVNKRQRRSIHYGEPRRSRRRVTWVPSLQERYEDAEPLYQHVMGHGGHSHHGPSSILHRASQTGWAARESGESERVSLHSQYVPCWNICSSTDLCDLGCHIDSPRNRDVWFHPPSRYLAQVIRFVSSGYVGEWTSPGVRCVKKNTFRSLINIRTQTEQHLFESLRDSGFLEIPLRSSQTLFESLRYHHSLPRAYQLHISLSRWTYFHELRLRYHLWFEFLHTYPFPSFSPVYSSKARKVSRVELIAMDDSAGQIRGCRVPPPSCNENHGGNPPQGPQGILCQA